MPVKEFWERLKAATHFDVEAKPWKGEGTVAVSMLERSLIFREEGKWLHLPMDFKNTYRWTLQEESLTLEHLRLGKPVFLASFTSGGRGLVCKKMHQCGNDVYFGELFMQQGRVCLYWKITGPSKDQEITALYSSAKR